MDKAERGVLSADDVLRITEEARGEPFWPLWVVIANTGLRVSEALGLAWSDVDLTRREIRVRVQLARQDGAWVRRPLKTRKSKRTVPLTEDAIEALRVQRERQIVAQEVRPIDGLVFTTPTGYPIHSTNILPSWYATLSRLGLPRVTTHDLRHSAATIMFRQGAPIEAIADLLGHSTTRVTADLYRHRVPEVQRSAVDLLAKAIRG
jgi:integrase